MSCSLISLVSPTLKQPEATATFGFETGRGARTKSGRLCRSPATKKGRCRLHGGASGSGAPPGKRHGQYRHGERTKAAIAEQRKFSALLKMLRAGLT
jgi:glucans biosynthesis protein